MISESSYWKDPLLTAADWLETVRFADDELKRVRAEQELLLGFFGIRKLLDTFKVSDSTRDLVIRVEQHKCVKRVDYLNSHRIDELYDLASSTRELRDLNFVCNQFVHSYVLSIVGDENDNFSGCFVASDYVRNSKVYFVSSSNILSVFRTVGQDYPRKITMDRDEETGQWSGSVE